MYTRSLKGPENKSFFLFGPRGTGKTSWVKRGYPEAIYLDLLRPDLFNDLLARPERLETMIPPHFNNWVIIDEVQKIPQLLSEIHRLIEDRRLKFILTGSSARKLRQKGVNLLAGRALTYSMHPLTIQEIGNDFKLDRALKTGLLPEAYLDVEPQLYLESYVKTYLKEEVQQEGITRNLGAFSRFLETASFSQASVLNISEVSRECSIDRKAAENYFGILEDLLIATRLPPFTKRAKRRMITHPKFFFFDTGVFRTLRPMGPVDKPEEAEGAALETLFFQELRALNDYHNLGYSLHYWRTSNQLEVDFIAYGPRGIRAFEIKRSSHLTRNDLSSLNRFLEEYPMSKVYLLYGGNNRSYEGKITTLPLEEGLKKLTELL
ncbi:MAG: ATP-binding protein [Deltaproteobacteria bacterium]|nr:ATP-binding protein [Deltaproteobacteria bacterium]MBI4374409.1 ATP-binding protein [Deltaproteobacteria bacterium]